MNNNGMPIYTCLSDLSRLLLMETGCGYYKILLPLESLINLQQEIGKNPLRETIELSCAGGDIIKIELEK